MRRYILILTLALGLVATTNARAEELLLLDNLVVEEPELDHIDLLEELVKAQLIPQQPKIQKRLLSFFKQHKVQRPDYYASLLARHPMPESKKKIMAAIIVPESRGKANAVNPQSGATGVWQVMQAWKRRLGIKGSLKDPVVNLDAASRVFDIHYKEAKNNMHRTLVAYSGRTPGYATKVERLAATI